MAERWAQIAKFLIGVYEVSTLGNVRIVQRIGGSEIIQPIDVSSGWLYMLDGKRYGVNILVASSFLPNPRGCVAVSWKDGNSKNNCVSNLEWVELQSTGRADVAPEKAESKMVCQYSKSGELLAEFGSIPDAAKLTGTNPAHIRKCLSGSRASAGNCIWRWSVDGPPTELAPRFCACRQLSLTGEFIAEFDTIDEAAQTLGLVWQRIVGCCNGEMKNTGGFTWEYRDRQVVQKSADETKSRKKEPHIRQYMPNGLFMFEHSSSKSAARSLDLEVEDIVACCTRKLSTVGGYVWRYTDDDELRGVYEKSQKEELKRKKEEVAKKQAESWDSSLGPKQKRHRRCKPVRQYTLDGFFVHEYVSVKEASEATKAAKSNIMDCCKRRKGHISCKGFIWRYAEDDEFAVKSGDE